MIAPETHMGAVHLTVADLERSRAYYVDAIGLEDLGDGSFGAGGVQLLRLVEEPGARPSPGHTGLFHFALVLPDRRDLSAWLRHAIEDRVALTGASDHGVSEALYLRDPDHHGIEIYADRPGADQHVIGTWPLDVDDLRAASDAPTAALPAGTRMGHVHLCVADVGDTIAFWRDEVGLDLMAQLGDQAAFLSAGGYHHHLGTNTWESRGAAPAPAGTARLLHFTLVTTEAEIERLGSELRDPSGNLARLAPPPKS